MLRRLVNRAPLRTISRKYRKGKCDCDYKETTIFWIGLFSVAVLWETPRIIRAFKEKPE